jgi:DNA-binding CsgD family transcriptional regulator
VASKAVRGLDRRTTRDADTSRGVVLAVEIDSPHTLIAEGLVRLVSDLGHGPTLRVRGGSGSAADVALWDLSGQTHGYPAPGPTPTIAIISTGERELVRLLRLGYRGYLRAGADVHVLDRALRSVAAGELWAERRLLGNTHPAAQLTSRQEQVLGLLAKGLTNRSIAKALGISYKTVNAHVSSLLRKCSAHNRVELALFYSRDGRRQEPRRPSDGLAPRPDKRAVSP